MSTELAANTIERELAIERSIDPTGKKWVIHGKRGSALVHARPEPDRADAQIPAEFSGQWTSPTVLNEKLAHWLNRQWDISDRMKVEAAGKIRAGREKQAAEEQAAAQAVLNPRKTPEESLDALPEEVKEALGDIIAVKPDVTTLSWTELQSLAKEKGVKGRSKADLIQGLQALEG